MCVIVAVMTAERLLLLLCPTKAKREKEAAQPAGGAPACLLEVVRRAHFLKGYPGPFIILNPYKK